MSVSEKKQVALSETSAQLMKPATSHALFLEKWVELLCVSKESEKPGFPERRN